MLRVCNGLAGNRPVASCVLPLPRVNPLRASTNLTNWQVKLNSLRKCVGVIPQDTVLFNESVMYNIRYGRPDVRDPFFFFFNIVRHVALLEEHLGCWL